MFKGEIFLRSSILCVPLRQGLIQTGKVLFELAQWNEKAPQRSNQPVERHTRPHAQGSEHFYICHAQ